MLNPDPLRNPASMTVDECFDEIASILATGLVRMFGIGRARPTNALDSRGNSVEVSARSEAPCALIRDSTHFENSP